MSESKGYEKPICDYCVFFALDDDGQDPGVLFHGRCEHPEHPKPRSAIAKPCPDFDCELPAPAEVRERV